jgi:hypothetical protein
MGDSTAAGAQSAEEATLMPHRSERVLYFGVWDARRLGHAVYGPTGQTEHGTSLPPFLAPQRLDAAYAPQLPEQPQGLARLVHLGDWTLLAFWDRSADTRPDSNSIFIARGHFDFAIMLALAKDAFPAIWKRFAFDVVSWAPPSEGT